MQHISRRIARGLVTLLLVSGFSTCWHQDGTCFVSFGLILSTNSRISKFYIGCKSLRLFLKGWSTIKSTYLLCVWPKVKYDKCMDLLTATGFLACLQAVPRQKVGYTESPTKASGSTCVMIFWWILGCTYIRVNMYILCGPVKPWTNMPVFNFTSQVRTLCAGCLWWVAPPCSTWIYLSRGSTGRTYTRARGQAYMWWSNPFLSP